MTCSTAAFGIFMQCLLGLLSSLMVLMSLISDSRKRLADSEHMLPSGHVEGAGHVALMLAGSLTPLYTFAFRFDDPRAHDV